MRGGAGCAAAAPPADPAWAEPARDPAALDRPQWQQLQRRLVQLLREDDAGSIPLCEQHAALLQQALSAPEVAARQLAADQGAYAAQGEALRQQPPSGGKVCVDAGSRF